MSSTSVVEGLLGELDDAVVHAQSCMWLIRKKEKLVPKGVRLFVVGRFGIYLLHAKKVCLAFFFFFFSLLINFGGWSIGFVDF